MESSIAEFLKRQSACELLPTVREQFHMRMLLGDWITVC